MFANPTTATTAPTSGAYLFAAALTQLGVGTALPLPGRAVQTPEQVVYDLVMCDSYDGKSARMSNEQFADFTRQGHHSLLVGHYVYCAAYFSGGPVLWVSFR